MKREPILYPIPHKYFPGVKIIQPFHAKVNYKVLAGKVFIEDVCMSPKCLTYIDNTKGLVEDMRLHIQAAEDKLAVLHPVFQSAIAPHIKA